MPIPKKYIATFDESKKYHVICKGIAYDKLFYNGNNKYFFLNKYCYYLVDYVNTFAYNLLDNHVHLLIEIKTIDEIKTFLNNIPFQKQTKTQKRFLNGECSLHELIEQQFNKLFIGYTLSFNNVHNRKGHLFQRPFKRILVEDDVHFTQLIIYIHANSMKHQIDYNFQEYNWSSYQQILYNKQSFVEREKVLEWFGGPNKFIQLHKELAHYYYSHPLAGE